MFDWKYAATYIININKDIILCYIRFIVVYFEMSVEMANVSGSGTKFTNVF